MPPKRQASKDRPKKSVSSVLSMPAEDYPAEREARMLRCLDDFFWKAFFYLRMNQIDGDYLEFGCGSNVRSFRLAYKYRNLEYSCPRLFAFDSFQGLPEPQGIDRHPQWEEGAMAVSLAQFHRIMRAEGAKRGDYRTVPGFYADTLDHVAPQDYGIERAAMVFVDCDLYASAASVLRFVADILVDGAILAFDDWFCFNGDSNRGEQRACREFLEANPRLTLSEYLPIGWHGKSFLVHIAKRRRRR